MRILVTGGYGYIGGHLVNMLVSEGHDIVVLDSMVSHKPWKFPTTVNLITDSVTNTDAVARALKGVSVVYHLAARMDYDQSYRHPLRVYQTNVMGTATVLAMARGAGVDNIVVTSSAAVYGDVIEASEYNPTSPVNTYGCSKSSMEAACKDSINYGMNLKILRIFNVWGGQYGISIVNKLCDGHNILYGDGNQTRDLIHISDVVQALVQARKWDVGIYNIGTGEEITINGLWSLLRGNEVPTYGKPVAGLVEVERSCSDMSNTYQRVVWRPNVFLSQLGKEEVNALCV